MKSNYDRMPRSKLIETIRQLEKKCRDAERLEVVRAELDVHQRELESQEHQLQEAQALLEASRDAYAELYDFAPVAYFTLDRNGIVKEVNLMACSLLEIERARLIGLPLYGFVFDGDRGRFLDHLRRCRSGMQQVISELRIKTRAGKILPLLLTSRIVAADLDCVRTVMTDLSERQQVELEIRNLNASLEQRVRERTTALTRANEGLQLEIAQRKVAEAALQRADRLKDEFLAMLGHELRNPLAPLRQAVEIWRLARAADSEDLQQVQTIAERQIRHIAQLVDDLLDVSRISRGKIVLKRSPLDLNELAQDVARDFQSSFDASGLQLVLDLDNEHVWIDGDATRVSQILGNLLHNATKFTPRGGTISVRVAADAINPRALLVVRDTGMGIEFAELDHIFTTFYQTDQSLDRTTGGLGLGLALVKGLVELHGGEVTVESEGANRGAQFTLSFPSCAPANALPHAPVTRSSTRKYRILVIDDQRDALYTMNALLVRLGHEVITAQNGEQALKAAAEFHPDVIFSDIGLPGMDGYALARRMRTDPSLRSGRLIAVTGYGQASDQQRAFEAGFDSHLTKHVALDDLSRILEEM